MQVAAASGVYKNSDWAFEGVLGAVGGGAYTSTDEGKLVAGALLDNYNNVVRDIRDDPSLLKSTSQVGQANAQSGFAGYKLSSGRLSAKLDNVKVMSAPAREAEVVAKLAKNEEVVFSGRISRRVYIDSGRRCRGLGARDSDWRMILCGCSSMVERELPKL